MRALLLLTAAALVGAVLASPTSAADCPRISFLRLGDDVYRSFGIPPSVDLRTSGSLGSGLTDVPEGEDGCAREQKDVEVLSYEGIDPLVAVGVEGLPDLAFVLGNKCAGFTGDERWACLATPLVLDGTEYVPTAYPEQPPPRKTLRLGEALGQADLGSESVRAVRIDGVEPSVAVGVEGRDSEAYLALGVCPYELFDNRPLYDDLRRCLSAPVWLAFDPPAARSGETVVARPDRPVPAGETLRVSLVPSSTRGDIVPKDRSGEIVLGTLPSGAESSLSFQVPEEIEQGRYEAVVTCESCSSGEAVSVFPAGPIFLDQKGSGGPKVITIVLGIVFMAALVGAVVIWRKRRLERLTPRG